MEASVIIPCYNSSKTIKNLLKALYNQTKKAKEIIIVDDGSTDNIESIIKNEQKNRKNLVYIKQKNSGPAKARNTGAKRATTEILVFTDSDCVPEKNWLEEMIKPFENKEVGGVQGAYKTKQKEIIARFVQIEIEERYERMKHSKNIDWIGSYSAAFKRKEFLSLGGYDESFPIASGEDPEFSFRLAKSGRKLIFNPNAIVYHTHPNKLSKYLKTKYFRAYFRPKMYSKHKEKIITDSYTPQYLKVQIILFYLFIISAIGTFFGLNPIVPLFVIIIHAVLGLKLFLLGLKKDQIAGLVSIPLLFLRSYSFGLGLILGVINK